MPISDERALDYVAAVYAASEAYASGTREAELEDAIATLERDAPDHRLLTALREKLGRARVIGRLLVDAECPPTGDMAQDTGRT